MYGCPLRASVPEKEKKLIAPLPAATTLVGSIFAKAPKITSAIRCAVVSLSPVGAGSVAHTRLPGSAMILMLSKNPELAGIVLSSMDIME